ncbi:phosphodiester glycosidase family protein [Alistipes sp.]|uniref:phosphodiester glycosidase family protein n=1 Tax=Alistipes sp. TaxID=1872444 RepID=UPI0025BDAE68|nr:phosphodiester glycosidase family protein [Alistipes sp.]MCI7141025.1 phosphodiester glycosidase family protein [Alistipes sp.]MDY5395887.1 phosphodiester glycosidase family protein [Alistipes sp.]
MKRFFSLMTLFLAGGALLMTSCSSDDDDDNGGGGGTTGNAPFASVTAKDGASTMTATIDDTEKTIKFGEFQNTTDMSAVEVTFKMNKGHILKTPANLTSNVNLTVPATVVVLLNGKTEETYTMTAVVPEAPDAVLGAKVNGVDATVGEDNSITIKWEEGMEINHMVFELDLADGATVKSPEDCTFDLEFEEGKLVVNYLDEDITYTVKATDYKDPMLDLGWTDVTANFGTLPAYIKVYKTEKAAGIDGNIAYVAMIGSKAEMGCVGEGTGTKKTISDLEADGAYKVYLVGIDSSTVQLMVSDGKLVQANSRVTGTLGQNEDGSYQISYAYTIDNKIYTFPFVASGTYENPTADKGEAWAPKTAVAGLHMILYEGNILTSAHAMTNEGAAIYYGDADYYARSAVGITKYDKIFAFCGQQVEGSRGVSIPELAQIMKDFGCEEAIQFEASGTPNMHINKLETVVNSKVPNLKPVQVAIAFR